MSGFMETELYMLVMSFLMQREHIHTINCEGKYIVPGYIEPHTHPFQIYNPQTLAEYVSQFGTTTFVNDNLFFLLHSGKRKRLLY